MFAEPEVLPERSGALCWAQRYHYLRYRQAPPGTRHEAHISETLALPEGLTERTVRATLDALVRRHEILRTVIELDDDGQPRQRVGEVSPFALRLVTTEADGTPSPAAAFAALGEAEFDLAHEWPWRACLATTAGRPRRLHLVFNHIMFDDVSLERLREEMLALLAALAEGRPARLPAVPRQPVDLAREEARLTGAARVEAARRHWRGQIEAVPTDVLAARRTRPAPGDDRPAAVSAALTSPELLGLTRRIAAEHQVWPAAVHLAAYAVTTAAYTGAGHSAHRMYTSQREASGAGPLMTCMSYPTVVQVDLSDDPTFAQVLARTAGRVVESVTHAHVPYDEIVDLLAAEGRRRGRPVRLASEFNFLSNAPRSCGSRRDRLTRNPEPVEWSRAGSDTYVRVYEWSDGITLAMQALTSVMDAGTVELWLRGYAGILAVVAGPGADLPFSVLAGLPGFPPPAGAGPARTHLHAPGRSGSGRLALAAAGPERS